MCMCKCTCRVGSHAGVRWRDETHLAAELQLSAQEAHMLTPLLPRKDRGGLGLPQKERRNPERIPRGERKATTNKSTQKSNGQTKQKKKNGKLMCYHYTTSASSKTTRPRRFVGSFLYIISSTLAGNRIRGSSCFFSLPKKKKKKTQSSFN